MDANLVIQISRLIAFAAAIYLSTLFIKNIKEALTIRKNINNRTEQKKKDILICIENNYNYLRDNKCLSNGRGGEI